MFGHPRTMFSKKNQSKLKMEVQLTEKRLNNDFVVVAMVTDVVLVVIVVYANVTE